MRRNHRLRQQNLESLFSSSRRSLMQLAVTASCENRTANGVQMPHLDAT